MGHGARGTTRGRRRPGGDPAQRPRARRSADDVIVQRVAAGIRRRASGGGRRAIWPWALGGPRSGASCEAARLRGCVPAAQLRGEKLPAACITRRVAWHRLGWKERAPSVGAAALRRVTPRANGEQRPGHGLLVGIGGRTRTMLPYRGIAAPGVLQQ